MKKILSSLFVLVLVFSSMSSAQAFKSTNSLSMLEQKQLKVIENKFELEAFELSKEEAASGDLMQFETVEEFELFLEDLKVGEPIVTETYIEATPEGEMTAAAKQKHTVSTWMPITGVTMSIFAMKNILVEYDTKWVNGHAQITSAAVLDSWRTGYSDIDWIHKYGVVSYSTTKHTRDTAVLKVYGVHVLGIAIGGQPIGYRWNAEWNDRLIIASGTA